MVNRRETGRFTDQSESIIFARARNEPITVKIKLTRDFVRVRCFGENRYDWITCIIELAAASFNELRSWEIKRAC